MWRNSVAGFPGDVFGHERFEGEFGDWKRVADEFHVSLGGMRLKIRIRQGDDDVFRFQLSHFVEFEPDGIGDRPSSAIEGYPFHGLKSALLAALGELWRGHRRQDKVGSWQANPDW